MASMGIGDGARLMRASWVLVQHDRALLWFPAASMFCFLATAGFWVYEGTWLYSLHGPWLFFVPLVAAGLYSLTFIGIFFNVALAGAADAVINGRATSFGDAVGVALSRLGPIAGWAAYSLFVQVALGFVESIKGFRWAGKAAEVAWSFATFFVVPLIALEGTGARDARRSSYELAKTNWRAESGGLGALKAAMLLPGLLCAGAYELLKNGDVHSRPAQLLLALVLAGGVVVGVVAGVVRQVFAVSLYRASPTTL
jgi:Family of unknown function (DUF6159)